MADLIAISTVGLQYCLIISIVDLYFRKILPLSIVVAIFVILISAGLAVWHKKRSWQTAKQWRKPILLSLIVGVAFFGCDLLLAHLNGQSNPLLFPGGLLGIPLTLAVCPGFTMICVAGLVRALYLSTRSAAHR